METRTHAFWQHIDQRLETARRDSLYREMPHDAEGLLNFADNDYLGLAREERLSKVFADAVRQQGAGAGAARLILGTQGAHMRLEKELAAFKSKEAALVYGSGYAANLGIVSALVGEGDLVLEDKLNHASLIDAARLSGAEMRVYPHKNMKRLEELLQTHQHVEKKLIITDSVFSMDGDVAPLKELVALKNKYGALLMIDEAHGTGVFGENGEGLAAAEGVEADIDIAMGTLSKALGLFGGFVAGRKALINYLINFSRPFIFATAPPPGLMTAGSYALGLVRQEPERRRRLWEIVKRVQAFLSDLGLETSESASPIIPIMLGKEARALEWARHLRGQGLLIPAIRYPTVKKGQARLRLTLSARHTDKDLEVLFSAFQSAKELL